MLKMKNHFSYVLIVCAFFLCGIGKAQENGIKFETGLSWQQVKAKAQAENKLIFMDCYATWCGPCKQMEQEIYPRKEVGDYLNAHFVNVKLQMDKTSSDEQLVRTWYACADSLSKLFHISAYPTYLFFSMDGQPLHETVGTSETTADFIERASAALDTKKQYFTIMAGWESHQTDSVYLHGAILAAQAANDYANARILVNQYIDCLKGPITEANFVLIRPYVLSESDKGFDLYLKNAGKIDEFKTGYAEQTLTSIIFKQEIGPLFLNKEAIIDWKKISDHLLNKYPTLNKAMFIDDLGGWFYDGIFKETYKRLDQREISPSERINLSLALKRRYPGFDCGKVMLYTLGRYYGAKQYWEESARAFIAMLDQYGSQMKPNSINDLIWMGVFPHTTDKKTLNKALKLMEDVIKKDVVKEEPEYDDVLDTYANLLYKLGRRQEAIAWENKAISAGEPQDNLKKMQKGEPTWAETPAASSR